MTHRALCVLHTLTLGLSGRLRRKLLEHPESDLPRVVALAEGGRAWDEDIESALNRLCLNADDLAQLLDLDTVDHPLNAWFLYVLNHPEADGRTVEILSERMPVHSLGQLLSHRKGTPAARERAQARLREAAAEREAQEQAEREAEWERQREEDERRETDNECGCPKNYWK